MVVITFLAVLIVLIIVVQSQGKLTKLREDLQLMHRQVQLLRKELEEKDFVHKEKTEQSPITPKPSETVFTEVTPKVVVPNPVAPSLPPETKDPVFHPISELKISDTHTTLSSTSNEPEDIFVLKKQVRQEPKKKTNLEQFIAEKLISIVGIAILVLGIFFTVKWAIDRHLISDAGKILIGLTSGTLLILVAHRLAKNYRAFSSILVGGGIAVFYFSIYEAYQSYHLITQVLAFAAMVFVTVAANALAVIYDKKELALVALVGGFSSPFLVSDGSGNYTVLFSYLLILNIGIFCLAYFKKWNIVQVVSYILTIVIFGVWIVLNLDDFEVGQKKYNAFLFATLFYLVFFGTTLIYNLRKKEKFAVLDLGILLSSTFLYFSAGYFFLGKIQQGYFQGMFTLSLGVFNFIFAYLFYRRKAIDRNLIYLLIGLVLTFVSLTAPIQLHGNYITLFWACEFVLLYWLGIKSNIPLIRQTSLLVVALCLGSLLLDYQHNYFSVQVNALPVLLNKAMIVSWVVWIALLMKFRLVTTQTEEQVFFGLLDKKQYAWLLGLLLLGVGYLMFFLEIQYQTKVRIRWESVSNLSLYCYHFMFVSLLFYTFKQRVQLKAQYALYALLAVTLLLYFLANFSIIQTRMLYLNHTISFMTFGIHALLFAAALWIIYMLWTEINRNFSRQDQVMKGMNWFLSILLVSILSMELIHVWVLFSYEKGFGIEGLVDRGIKTGWPILWSLISFGFMYIGMKHRWKQWRILSLSLFTLTILKLFLYDISNVGQGGKIAAFISLGILLLIVSFMYQKIKGLFLDEELETENKFKQ